MKLRKSIMKNIKVFVTLVIVCAVLIQFTSNGYVFAHSSDDTIATYNIGVNNDNVIATLTKDGTLTLSGSGETKDYTSESMPFSGNIDKITNIKIEDGVTSIGDYLFFGCKNLNDKLELPSSITSIGDYAFSGYSKETAPSFTYITNEFKTADISVPVEVKPEDKTSEETQTVPQDTADTQSINTPKSDAEQTTAGETKETTNQPEAGTADNPTEKNEDSNKDTEAVTVEETQTPQTNGAETTMEIKTITEQEIGVGIFFDGQSGGYRAEDMNKSFRTAVETVGYIEADRFVEVKLDGIITQHLAVKDGKMIIPTLPNFGIVSPEANDAYTTHSFTGWSIDSTIYQPKDKYEIADSKDTITLTSQWKTEWSINPQVKTEAKEEVSIYSVIDGNTGSALEEVEGYSINVQWQINTADKDDESAWENIKGATSLTYEREVEAKDIKSFFRAQISIDKKAKARLLNSSEHLITDAVNGVNGNLDTGKVTIRYHYNDINGLTGVSDEFKDYYNKDTKTVSVSANFTKLTASKDLYGELVNASDLSQYEVPLINNPFHGMPNSANNVTNVNGLAAWVYGNESNPYINWNYANGEVGNNSGQYNLNEEKNKPNYYMPDSSYVLTDDEKKKIDNGENITLDFYAYWGQIVYVSQDGTGNKDGSSSANSIGIGSTNFDAAFDKFSGGDMFSNVIMLTSDTRFGKNETTINNTINIGRSHPATISSLQKAEGGTYKFICANRGPVLTADLRFSQVSIQTEENVYPRIECNNNYLFMDDGLTNSLIINGNLKDLNNFDTAGDDIDYNNFFGYNPENYWMGVFGGNKGLRIESGIFRRITGNGYTVNSTIVLNYNTYLDIDGSNVANPVVLTHEAVGALSNTNYNTTVTLDGYVVGIGVYAGASVANLYVGGSSEVIVKESAKLALSEYIDGKQTVIKGIYGGGSAGYIKGESKVQVKTSALILGNIYGGGRANTSYVGGNTTLTVGEATIIGNVYGGGNAAHSKNIVLNISNATIKSTSPVGSLKADGYIFGGGLKGNVSEDVVLNINEGTKVIGNIYGGCDSSGIVSGSTTINIAGEVKDVYAGGRGNNTTATNTNLNIKAGANIKGNAFGGSEEGTVTNSNVSLNGGYAANVFGGSDKASVTGTTTITSSAGSNAGNIYAGCNASGSVKNPEMNLAGKADHVFAGGNATSKDVVDIDGNSTINVMTNEDNIISNVYGGANNTGLVTNSIINISGYAKNVYGGGLGANTITNTPTINVLTNGNITGDLYGGGEEGVTHGTTVSIKAGTVNNAYAGGHKAGVDGTVKISSETGSTVTNMYGGSNESGNVSNPTVTVKGKATNVYGGGFGAGTTTTTPTVNIDTGANVINSVFGGGNLGNVSSPTVKISDGNVKNAFAGGNAVGVTGTVTLTTMNAVQGSNVENIYGGSNSSGTVESPVLSIAGNATNVYGGGFGGASNGSSGTVTNSPTITISAGTISNVYGGGEKGPTIGTNTLQIQGGVVTNVFGAGKSIGAENTDIEINNNAKVTNIYGGSESSGNTVSSKIYIDGDVVNVYGGGKGKDTIVNTSYAKTTEKAAVMDIYGGSEEGTVKNATLVIQGPVKGSIYGGGYGNTSVIDGNTWVFVANNVNGNVYGGGNQGTVKGNTHVDIADGVIGIDSDNTTGNVFGGSNQAKVQGDTKVHIGTYVVDKPTDAEIPDNKSIDIKGTVFGGGNTTSTGKDFDASDPYVIGSATVQIGGNEIDTLKIGKSIFGDGNKCVVNGDKIVTIKQYNGKNTSVQRATILTLEESQLELIGEKDTANLVTTIDYSLNRIDNLILKGGTELKLQSGVNLVMGFESQNSNGKPQTRDDANNDLIGNKLYIQQGQHAEFRINEDVSRPGYGDIKGFAQLGRYYTDGSSIDNNAQGVYIMGSYYQNASDNNNSGFIVAQDEKLADQTELKKGDIIEPTTNSSSWRNWLLGSSVKNVEANVIVSEEPGNGKIAQIKGWGADGSIYRINENSLVFNQNGGNYKIVNPDNITSNSDENTIGLSIETGQTGWLEQVKAGYIDSGQNKIVPYKTSTTLSTNNSLDMRSIVNTSQDPIINVKLYNTENITAPNKIPSTVVFTIDKIAQQPDGSEIKTGTIKVKLNITKETPVTYKNILISQGKVYDRAEQTFDFDGLDKVATSVSKASSITAQFAEKTDSPKTVSGYDLLFTSGRTTNSVTLPVGTKILMVDRSGSMPVYYNYTVPTGGITNVSLTEFKKNGTSDEYALPSSAIMKSNFLFVVDFVDASGFSNSDICMTMKSTFSGGASFDKKVRFAVIGDQRQYEMTSVQDNSSETTLPSYRMNGTFGLTLKTAVTNLATGTDTTGSDKQMAARIQLKLTNTSSGAVLPIPNGWQILSNGTRYSTSGDSATIILANSLTAADSDIYVIMSNMGNIPAGNYQLEISLVSGAMANYPSVDLSSNKVTYKFKLTDDRYSIKATIRDENKQIISKTEVDKSMVYDILRVSNGSSSLSDVTTKVTLWKKENDVYTKVSFNENVESIIGVTIDNSNNYGVLPWSTFKTVTVKLKAGIGAGSYRLRYDIIQMVKKENGTEEENILASGISPFIITE